jgi:hypothetical protein
MGTNWTMFHGLPGIVLGPPERDKYTAKLEAMMIDQIAIGIHEYCSSLITWAPFCLIIDLSAKVS